MVSPSEPFIYHDYGYKTVYNNICLDDLFTLEL